jgi:hypothetical protein
MTPREGFKYGFLLRCAEEGLTVKQAEARAVRALEKRGGEVWDTIKGVGGAAKDLIMGPGLGSMKTILGYGIPIGLGAAAIGGGGLGYGLAKMQEGDIDPADVQREELINAYRTQAELARRKSIMDAAQLARPRPRSHVGI